MLKKLLTAAAASAFALTLYVAPASACPGSDKSGVAEKADKKKDAATKKAEKKSDGKKKNQQNGESSKKKAS